MRDRAAERGLRGGVGIDVDELVVLGRVGEGVDARLVDRQPVDTPTSSPMRARICHVDGISDRHRSAA